MSEEEKTFTVTLERVEGYKIDANFDLEGVKPLRMDEPPPLGEGSAPNASRVLAAAMGDCLSASLLFCLQRSRVEVHGLKTVVNGKLTRNEKGRWRITEISVDIKPEFAPENAAQLQRCQELFEDFCIVSKSVEQGISLKVNVVS